MMQYSPASSPSDEAAIDSARIHPLKQISRSADSASSHEGYRLILLSPAQHAIKEYLMGYEQWMAKGQADPEMGGRRPMDGEDTRARRKTR